MHGDELESMFENHTHPNFCAPLKQISTHTSSILFYFNKSMQTYMLYTEPDHSSVVVQMLSIPNTFSSTRISNLKGGGTGKPLLAREQTSLKEMEKWSDSI